MVVDSGKIHEYLNTTYSVFKDDNTISGKSYNLRDKTTKAIQDALIKVLITGGISVIFDACNSKKEKRKRFLDSVKELNKNIITIIIHVNIPVKYLLQRLKREDAKLKKMNQKPAWTDLYLKIQKPSFTKPEISECDILLTYSGNDEEILAKIESVLAKGI